MERLEGRVAIVTGAARGLGAAIAERLAAEKASVVLVDRLEEVAKTAETIAAKGGSAVGLVEDLGDPAAIERLVATVLERRGRIDILVNNAGISPKKDGKKIAVDEMDLAGWQSVIQVNLTSCFLLCKACFPALRRSEAGRIVNISSQAGRTRPLNTSAHYAASKAGMIGFSRAFANEAGPFGITVNCVAPGLIETPMFMANSEEARRASIANVPLRKLGSPSDIAAAVAFLVSDDARYISGTTLDVNGGLFMT